MLSPMFTKPTSTAQLDELAKAIAKSMVGTFDPAPKFDGNKKNKLRDMASKLCGYENGYQQFKADVEKTFPKPTVGFSLPDEICVATVHWDYGEKLLITKHHDDADRIENLDHEDEAVLHALAGYEGSPLDDVDNLMDIPVWMYICFYYEVHRSVVIMPNIDEYGVEDVAISGEAIEWMNNVGLNHSCDYMADAIDRGDDGTSTFVLYLRKKK